MSCISSILGFSSSSQLNACRGYHLSPQTFYTDYLNFVYNCKFIISDSGTSQEEPALLDTKVIVPRDFTERPESIENDCSFMLNEKNFQKCFINQFDHRPIPKLVQEVG
jgi:UDP-N-acetylglucosamine 2-epimerase (non-hydrolysing)